MSRPKSEPLGNATAPAEVEVPPENILPIVVPPLPEGLKALPHDQRREATAVWENLWTLGHGFYLPETDGYVVERYAVLQARRTHLLEILNAEDYTTIGSQGQQVAHPAARLLLDVEAKLLPLEQVLGLNPEARLRLGLAVAETKSKLDAFLDGD